MTRNVHLSIAAALLAFTWGAAAAPSPVRAEDHSRVAPRGGFRHEGHERFEHREFRRGPTVGLFFGAPGVVVPPPVYYAPDYYPYAPYAYAPVPVSGIYITAYGYCRDYRTNVGIETACQQPDGVWRFIN